MMVPGLLDASIASSSSQILYEDAHTSMPPMIALGKHPLYFFLTLLMLRKTKGSAQMQFLSLEPCQSQYPTAIMLDPIR